jgi:Holliday junction DNA helicase RuvA
MLATISGTLSEVNPLLAVVEVQGFGYEVHIPLTTMEQLPSPGQSVRLYTLAVYREDSQTLFGFQSREDRDFFRLLVQRVSGIGPKIALRIMSKLSGPTLKAAIASSDVALLSTCPGIGKRTAERLVVELKDKLGIPEESADTTPALSPIQKVATGGASPLQDAVSALIALGYKADEADKAVRRASGKIGSVTSTEELIKTALS